MFNIGGPELLVILLLALLVLGPSRLPDAARSVGKAMAEVRKLSTGFQNEVRSALEEAEPRRIIDSVTTTASDAPQPPEAPASGANEASPAASSPTRPAVAKASPRRRSAPLRATRSTPAKR